MCIGFLAVALGANVAPLDGPEAGESGYSVVRTEYSE